MNEYFHPHFIYYYTSTILYTTILYFIYYLLFTLYSVYHILYYSVSNNSFNVYIRKGLICIFLIYVVYISSLNINLPFIYVNPLEPKRTRQPRLVQISILK